MRRQFRMARLRRMQKVEDNGSLHKVFPFVAELMERSTEHEETEPMPRVHTQYSEIVGGVPGYMRHCA